LEEKGLIEFFLTKQLSKQLEVWNFNFANATSGMT